MQPLIPLKLPKCTNETLFTTQLICTSVSIWLDWQYLHNSILSISAHKKVKCSWLQPWCIYQYQCYPNMVYTCSSK
jgi:hypothetical protein